MIDFILVQDAPSWTGGPGPRDTFFLQIRIIMLVLQFKLHKYQFVKYIVASDITSQDTTWVAIISYIFSIGQSHLFSIPASKYISNTGPDCFRQKLVVLDGRVSGF